MKKILAALLAVLMVASLFAGCANEKPAETTGEVANTTAAPAETTAPADTTAAPEEIVNLKWVSVGGGMPTNYEAWAVHLNEYLEEKIGVHLEMEIIGWGDWDTRRNMIVSTNEPYDIMFTNSSSYFNDVNIGAFMDIGELVETAAPELVKFIPADYWNACRINGKLYAVPTYKDSSHSQYFVYDKALVEEVYPEYKDAHTLAEAAPAVVAMSEKLGSPALILRKEGFNSICGIKFDSMSTGLDAIGVSYDDDPAHPKVVITVEQDDLLDDLKILHDLYTNGYINSDAAILDETPKYRAFNAAQGWPAAAQTSWGPNMGTEAVAVQWQKTVLSNATVQGSMNCISAVQRRCSCRPVRSRFWSARRFPRGRTVHRFRTSACEWSVYRGLPPRSGFWRSEPGVWPASDPRKSAGSPPPVRWHGRRKALLRGKRVSFPLWRER